MRTMTSREIHGAIQQALKEVSRDLRSGKLDRSGRFYSESEWKEILVRSKSVRSNRSTRSSTARIRTTPSR